MRDWLLLYACTEAARFQLLSCCDGKTGSCCDQSCLDRIALRECKSHNVESISQGELLINHLLIHLSICTQYSTHNCLIEGSPASSWAQGIDGMPCVGHAAKTRRTYDETLEALGCICRALIALGQESCCMPPRRSPTRNVHCRSKEKSSDSRASVDLCCAASGVDATASSARRRPTAGDSCCSAKGTDGELALSRTLDSSVNVSCIEQRPASLVTGLAHATDLEKGFAETEQEHVILSISGMTCTGCETKTGSDFGHPSSSQEPEDQSSAFTRRI